MPYASKIKATEESSSLFLSLSHLTDKSPGLVASIGSSIHLVIGDADKKVFDPFGAGVSYTPGTFVEAIAFNNGAGAHQVLPFIGVGRLKLQIGDDVIEPSYVAVLKTTQSIDGKQLFGSVRTWVDHAGIGLDARSLFDKGANKTLRDFAKSIYRPYDRFTVGSITSSFPVTEDEDVDNLLKLFTESTTKKFDDEVARINESFQDLRL